jgi:hypothetical protein
MSAKKYESNAEKQKAYRERHLEPPTTDDPKAWEKYLQHCGLGMTRGSTINGHRIMTGLRGTPREISPDDTTP